MIWIVSGGMPVQAFRELGYLAVFSLFLMAVAPSAIAVLVPGRFWVRIHQRGVARRRPWVTGICFGISLAAAPLLFTPGAWILFSILVGTADEPWLYLPLALGVAGFGGLVLLPLGLVVGSRIGLKDLANSRKSPGGESVGQTETTLLANRNSRLTAGACVSGLFMGLLVLLAILVAGQD